MAYCASCNTRFDDLPDHTANAERTNGGASRPNPAEISQAVHHVVAALHDGLQQLQATLSSSYASDLFCEQN